MEQLVNFIIRPPRAEYDSKSDLLDQEFMLKGQWFQRKDVEVTNSRGDVLQCSHYMPLIIPDGMKLPCVIYCHGNSGCRADASEAAIILLPSYITVFTLDFSGSGLSGGEHVTLGWNEKDDLKAVVDYLRSDGNISCIGLWGRSMGAVTSLLYGAEDLSIAGMVLDSPFSDLVDLMMELVDTYRFRFPKFTVKFAIQYMRRVIQKKAKFDIMDLNTIKVAKSCFVPVLIGHSTDDDFIHPRHSELIYDAYVGDKNIIKFEGDHNSPRPQFYFDSITIFFHNVLQPPKDAIDGNYFDPADDYLGKASWDTMHDIGYANHSFMDSKGLGTSSTEDAINELRQKRSMSQMVVPSKIPCNETTSGKEDGHAKDPFPSSSGVISLEFSNGHPYVPLTPSTIDDDQYIEYPLENPSDFPCNTEEEDRMFMEAIIESLKHLDTQEQKQLQQAGTITPDLSREGPPSSQESEHSRLSKEDSSSASGTNNTNDLSCSSPDVSESSSAPTLGTPTSILESGSMGASTRSDRSVNGQNFTDGDKSITHDTAGGTRATLTVQKNPSGNIMDGLMHRWGLNFFKNS